MPRYSLGNLFGFIAMCGVACLLLSVLPAIVEDTGQLISGLSIRVPVPLTSPAVLGTAIFLLVATFAVWRSSRRPRHFASGFLTASWAYFLLVNATPPSLRNVFWTEQFILVELARSDPSSWEAFLIIYHPETAGDLHLIPNIAWFLGVGHFVWMLIAGSLGGMVALVFAPRMARSSCSSRVAPPILTTANPAAQ